MGIGEFESPISPMSMECLMPDLTKHPKIRAVGIEPTIYPM